MSCVCKWTIYSLYRIFTRRNGSTAKHEHLKSVNSDPASFIWLSILENANMLRNTTQQQAAIKMISVPFDLDWGGIRELNSNGTAWDSFKIKCRSCSRLWLGWAENQWCVSIHLCEGACGGFLSQVGVTLLLPRTEFSGVESLSRIIDGDPPESMRLGNQGSPTVWQATRPSVGETGWGLCVMFMREPGASE